MPVCGLSFYLDEDVGLTIADGLKEDGHDVVLAVEHGHRSAAHGWDDKSQLLYASGHGRVLVTHNRRHFRKLHARFQRKGMAHAGIILLTSNAKPERIAAGLRRELLAIRGSLSNQVLLVQAPA